MKKISLLFFLVLLSVSFAVAQSSKVVYSNALTHFYDTF